MPIPLAVEFEDHFRVGNVSNGLANASGVLLRVRPEGNLGAMEILDRFGAADLGGPGGRHLVPRVEQPERDLSYSRLALSFNQGVDGSIPSGLTNHFKRLQPDPGEAKAIFACKTTTGSIEVTERGHGGGEVTAIDLPAERAAALAKAILAHVGQAR